VENGPLFVRKELVFADDDVGREAYGGGVPVVKGADVVHVVFVGTDGAREKENRN
jgi:hypothetical protein